MTLTKGTSMILDNDSVAVVSSPGDPAVSVSPVTQSSSCDSYTIAGATANSVVTLTIPTTATLTGPGASISVGSFTVSPASGTFSTNAAGGATFYIGATRAALAANQTAGTYSGTSSPVSATVNGTTKTRNTDTEKCTVIASIACTQTSNLNFGDAAQNDAAKTMSPSTAPSGAGWAGTPSRAAFSITGKASMAYSVSVSPASVTMTTGAGGANETIVVSSFTYYSTTAASSSSASLSTGGTDTLYVAGTQAAIGAAQVAGTYVSPAFTVTVTYQ